MPSQHQHVGQGVQKSSLINDRSRIAGSWSLSLGDWDNRIVVSILGRLALGRGCTHAIALAVPSEWRGDHHLNLLNLHRSSGFSCLGGFPVTVRGTSIFRWLCKCIDCILGNASIMQVTELLFLAFHFFGAFLRFETR